MSPTTTDDPPVIDPPDHAKMKVARAAQGIKNGRLTDADMADARRGLAAAKIQQAIERALASAPPLTDRQCEVLAGLLRGADPAITAAGDPGGA